MNETIVTSVILVLRRPPTVVPLSNHSTWRFVVITNSMVKCTEDYLLSAVVFLFQLTSSYTEMWVYMNLQKPVEQNIPVKNWQQRLGNAVNFELSFRSSFILVLHKSKYFETHCFKRIWRLCSSASFVQSANQTEQISNGMFQKISLEKIATSGEDQNRHKQNRRASKCVA